MKTIPSHNIICRGTGTVVYLYAGSMAIHPNPEARIGLLKYTGVVIRWRVLDWRYEENGGKTLFTISSYKKGIPYGRWAQTIL
jgi:hypothetical protein